MTQKDLIVFAPLSIRNGMAGAKRMGNLVEFLKNEAAIINLYRSGKDQPATEAGVKYRPARSFFSDLGYLRKLKKQQAHSKYTYYYYGYPSLQLILKLLMIRLAGYHIFFDIVEDYRTIIPYKKGMLKKLNLSIAVWLLKRSWLFASGYIAISAYLDQMLKGYFKTKKPVLLLPISINPHNFPGNNGHNTTGKISFFYGGSYAPKDDFDVMLRSFVTIQQQYPDKIDCFYLSGKCPANKQAEIVNIAGPETAKSIVFLGFLSDEEYYHYIHKANVLVMPRNNSDFANTGFPFKLGEYMATGNCVISARIKSVTDVIGEDTIVYYTPESEESLTQTFAAVLNDTNLLTRSGEKTRKIAFEKFNAQDHALLLKQFITAN